MDVWVVEGESGVVGVYTDEALARITAERLSPDEYDIECVTLDKVPGWIAAVERDIAEERSASDATDPEPD